MLRSYRHIVFALVGIALAGTSPPHQPDQNSNAAANHAQADVPTYQPYADLHSERCYESGDHEAADLCAQWRAAYAAEETTGFAYWGNWISAVGALLSFTSIVLVLFALKQGSKANEIAEDTAKRQLRAYIATSDYQIFRDPDELEKIRVVLICENLGETPAKDVTSTLFVLANSGTFSDAVHRPEPEIDYYGGRAVIGKGGKKQTAIAVEVAGAPVDEILGGDFAICFYGRIRYSDIFGEVHETRYCAYTDAFTRSVGMNHADAPTGNSLT